LLDQSTHFAYAAAAVQVFATILAMITEGIYTQPASHQPGLSLHCCNFPTSCVPSSIVVCLQVFATILAMITEEVNSLLVNARSGKQPLALTGHILLLNWNHQVRYSLQESAYVLAGSMPRTCRNKSTPAQQQVGEEHVAAAARPHGTHPAAQLEPPGTCKPCGTRLWKYTHLQETCYNCSCCNASIGENP
jgi:isoleucyl-tRNA synthetase